MPDEKCKHYENQTAGPWCNAFKWRLNKHVTKDPCVVCPKKKKVTR